MKRLISTISVFLACSVCWPVSGSQEYDRRDIKGIAKKLSYSVGTESRMDREILADGLYSILSYIANERSDSVLKRLNALDSISDLQSYILEELDKAPMELGLEALLYWDRTISFDYKNKEMTEFETENFLLYTYKGSKAYQDIIMISSAFEKHLDELLRFVKADRKKFGRDLSYLEKGKIVVELPPNSKKWKNFHSTAQTRFEAVESSDDTQRFMISLAVPYYNALSLASITHEITHIIDLLLKIDPKSAAYWKSPEDEKEFWEFFNTVVPAGTPIGEGFAEYTSMRLNPFHRNFLLAPEKRLKRSCHRRNIRDNILKSPTAARNRNERLFQYTELHSLVTYLIEKYGMDKFVEFYFSPPLNEEQLIKIYRRNFEEIERDWKEYYNF